LPPVVEGSERIVRNSWCTCVEGIDERLALVSIQEITIEDIKAVLYFAVVGHAVGVA
jgi:hypothetical protein